MSKNSLQKAVDLIPDIANNLKDWVKENFEEHSKTVLDNSSGTIGIIIKIFGKGLIDRYFDKKTKEKLSDFGTQTYLQAAFKQASNSIILIKEELSNNYNEIEIIQSLEKSIELNTNNLNHNNTVLVFQTKYHPAVVKTKKIFVDLLISIETRIDTINKFKKHFNDNIEETIKESFGDDYQLHTDSIKKYLFEENETNLLISMSKIGKIGFSDNENLIYEETYAKWQEIQHINNSKINIIDNNEDDKEYQKIESSLKPIKQLIDNYFKVDPENSLDKILFLVSDFGKGKSVFLKHYCSELAKSYLLTAEGYLPIYFNLRNYSNYSNNQKLGIIQDFLQTDYAINIDSDYYRNKKYIYLIDSLDESGELDRISIEKVVESVKRIQNIDKTLYRTNRIIVTTRPFDAGLESIIHQHKPFAIKNKENKDIGYYISLFGFKKAQLNNWLSNTIKQSGIVKTAETSHFAEKIIDGINNNNNIDIYDELLRNNTLSRSELQRPIFAYMIYQLIINNVDFLKVGKIGVYLSFLNLLSKEAKHINDPTYKVNLKEEFEFRNILHAIASLWMYARHQGQQGALNKADICRVLDGEKSAENDQQILERYKNQKVLEIEFLSHSYFGESSNTLHFQHQSFAEILLAEYYLKVFIKYALDEDSNIEEARTKLIIGKPTDQTIIFLSELLQLLKETSSEILSDDVLQKRKLLFPLFASLATRKNNSFFLCNEIYYNWFQNCRIEDNTSEYPEYHINNWCIKEKHINKIANLSKEIINSKNNYYLTQSELKNSLYDKELTLVKGNDINNLPLNMDRWLALLVGNKLYNDISNNTSIKLFNRDFNVDADQLFSLINNNNIGRGSNSIPNWSSKLFMGINMINTHNSISVMKVLNNIDISYSYLKEIDFFGSFILNCNFNYVTFQNVSLYYCKIFDSTFEGIIVDNDDIFPSGINIEINSLKIPFDLFNANRSFARQQPGKVSEKITIPALRENIEFNPHDYSLEYEESSKYKSILSTLSCFFLDQLSKKRISIKDIQSKINFVNKNDKNKFIKYLKDYKKVNYSFN